MKPCRKCGATKRMPDGRCRACHTASVALRKRRVVAEAKATKRPMFEDCTPGESELYVHDRTLRPGQWCTRRVRCPGGWVTVYYYSTFDRVDPRPTRR